MGSKRVTLEKFIERSNIIHNNKYTYEYTIYEKSSKKVIITCPIHGNFTQTAGSHLKHGCRKCSNDKVGKRNKKSPELWIEDFNKKHNFKYRYPEKIENAKNKIKIICPIHGLFEQSAYAHMNGYGCQSCKADKLREMYSRTDEQWRERFKIVHNDLYKYPDYITSNGKIRIICQEHGDFYQTCKDHSVGKGCRKCYFENSNFRKSDWIKKAKGREGTFYILKCWNEEEEFFKFGITYRTTKKRYESKVFMPYNWKIIKEVKSFDLEYIWNLEKRFQRIKRNQLYEPKIKFAGSKIECFKL